jgi:hypothetical protein
MLLEREKNRTSRRAKPVRIDQGSVDVQCLRPLSVRCKMLAALNCIVVTLTV